MTRYFASLLRCAGLKRLSVVLCLLLSLSPQVHAQGTLNIVAIVNDDVISAFDLGQRVQLTILQSNLPRTSETQQRIAPAILRRLVSEKLYVQEAARLGIELDDGEVDRGLTEIEARLNLPAGGLQRFLDQAGIDIDIVRESVLAERSWRAVIGVLFRNIVSVSDVEIEDILRDIEARKGKTEFLTGEIFLAYDNASRSEVMNNAQQLISQLRRGSTWTQIARNFSDAPSAIRGGLVDWKTVDEFEPTVSSALTNLAPNQITDPITTDEGVYIILLRESRTAPGIVTSEADPTVTLQQLHLAVPSGADSATIASASSRARALTVNAASCGDLQTAAENASPLSGPLGTFQTSQLSPQLRGVVSELVINTPSAPVRTADGVIVLMVCERSGVAEDPMQEARERIRLQLLNERLGRLANQHEQKIRRDAFIDIRL